MPIALALTAGFIQSAISPTVLVTGMLELQRRGYGQAKGQPEKDVHACMHSSPIDLVLQLSSCTIIIIISTIVITNAS